MLGSRDEGRLTAHNHAPTPDLPAAELEPTVRPRSPWRRILRTRLLVVDATAVYLAVIAAFWVRWGRAHVPLDEWQMTDHYALTSLTLFTVWMLALYASGSRRFHLLGSASQEYSRVISTTFAVFGALAILAYLTRWEIGRSFVAVALPTGIALLVAGRYLLRRNVRRQRLEGRAQYRVLLLGDPWATDDLEDDLRAHREVGLDVVTTMLVPADNELTDVVDAVDAHGADIVVIAGSCQLTAPELKRLQWLLEPHKVRIAIAPGLNDIARTRLRAAALTGTTLLFVEPPGYTSSQQTIKRAMDLTGATVLLVVFAIPLLITALAIKVTSPGPVLFKQDRVGANGHMFQIYKFRSMVAGAEHKLSEVVGDDVGIYYKAKDDPRVTPVGRFIRRYSVDELPQLINVLRGEMSLVGPRPLTPHGADLAVTELGRRLLVSPGMTGLWQVSGRNSLSVEESVRLDLYYVENWSVIADLLILLRTAKAVFGHDGAS